MFWLYCRQSGSMRTIMDNSLHFQHFLKTDFEMLSNHGASLQKVLIHLWFNYQTARMRYEISYTIWLRWVSHLLEFKLFWEDTCTRLNYKRKQMSRFRHHIYGAYDVAFSQPECGWVQSYRLKSTTKSMLLIFAL